jgi:hypothetical protein
MVVPEGLTNPTEEGSKIEDNCTKRTSGTEHFHQNGNVDRYGNQTQTSC